MFAERWNSIGSTSGMVKEPHARRYKGTITDFMDTRRAVHTVVSQLADRMEDFNRDIEYSKFLANIFVSPHLVSYLERQLRDIDIITEAGVAIDYRTDMLKVGHNKPERRHTRAERLDNDQRVRDALQETARMDLGNELRAVKLRGYTASMVDSSTDLERDMDHLYLMLGQFGYNRQEADAVLADKQSTVGVTRDVDGTPVGMAIIERADVRLSDGRIIKLAELTDAFTSTVHRGNGLYLMLSTELLCHFDHAEDKAHVIYAESNIDSRAILKVAGLQRRRFSGILERSALIEGDFKSLIVTYFPGADLSLLHQQLERLRRDG